MKQASPTNRQAIGILLLSVVAGAIGQLTLKAATSQMGKLELSIPMLLKLGTNPIFILALGIYFVSAVLWMLALMRADLSFAYPFLSLTYIAVLVGGVLLFHEDVTRERVLGCAVIIAGLLIIARGENKSSPALEPTE